MTCLRELGVNVKQRLPLHPTVNESNFRYLFTKALRMNHALNVGATSQHQEGGVAPVADLSAFLWGLAPITESCLRESPSTTQRRSISPRDGW